MNTTGKNEQIQINLCRSSRGISMTAMIIVAVISKKKNHKVIYVSTPEKTADTLRVVAEYPSEYGTREE